MANGSTRANGGTPIPHMLRDKLITLIVYE
jgi:hypothetical protein